jgi:hypothetical protein
MSGVVDTKLAPDWHETRRSGVAGRSAGNSSIFVG